MSGQKVQLRNCKLLRDHVVGEQDLWWTLGGETDRAKVIDPQANFWAAQKQSQVRASHVFDCKGLVAIPGYIDLQINGAFGVDFTHLKDHDKCSFGGFPAFSRKILHGGCTSFCPTLITSTPESYRQSKAMVNRCAAEQSKTALQRAKLDSTPLWPEGFACSLGMHLEGPFITSKGAHPERLLRAPTEGFKTVSEVYGGLHGVVIVTIAPEMSGSPAAIEEMTKQGVVCSLGHSKATLSQGIEGVRRGARFITHLFNAMEPFHHRDPGLVGLLGMTKHHNDFFYGLIPDGIHAHPASVNVAASSHPNGCVLVTDAMSAMGLPNGTYQLGDVTVDVAADVSASKAVVHGTNTLAGAVAPMDVCVRNFREFTQCSFVQAVEAATLHPAQCLRIENRKGSLAFGCDADVLLVDEQLNVHAVFVNGRLVWMRDGAASYASTSKL